MQPHDAVISRVARIINDYPPHPLGVLTPPPVLVGEGTLACEAAKLIGFGWGYPGDPLQIDCVASEPQWVQLAQSVLGRRAQCTFTRVPWLDPVVVAQSVVALDELWQKPQPVRGFLAGRSVYVAVDETTQGRKIVEAIESASPESRVCLLDRRPDNTLSLSAVIKADISWGAAKEHPAIAPPAAIFAQGCDQLEQQLAALVTGIERIMAAGNIDLAPFTAWVPDSALLLTPGELRAMAYEILLTLGAEKNRSTVLAAAELAFRLPTLVGRVGYLPHRSKSYQPILDYPSLERIAPLVHHAYQEFAQQSMNATESPLFGVAWDGLSAIEKSANRRAVAGSAIAFAVAGYDWRRTPQPKLPDLSANLNWLGELEHRRWAHSQRMMGREAHRWMKPWQELSPEVQRYDIHLMSSLTQILRHCGIEVCAIDADI